MRREGEGWCCWCCWCCIEWWGCFCWCFGGGVLSPSQGCFCGGSSKKKKKITNPNDEEKHRNKQQNRQHQTIKQKFQKTTKTRAHLAQPSPFPNQKPTTEIPYPWIQGGWKTRGFLNKKKKQQQKVLGMPKTSLLKVKRYFLG